MKINFDLRLQRGQLVYSYEGGLKTWRVRCVEASFKQNADYPGGAFIATYWIEPADSPNCQAKPISQKDLGRESAKYFTSKKEMLASIINEIDL